MRVNTKVAKKDLVYIDELDQDSYENGVHKFCCPVCLRYFNHILESNCCHNYICRLCIGDMAKKAKHCPSYVIRCVHCMAEDFKLTDADTDTTPREYTDTPAKCRRHRRLNQNELMILIGGDP